MPSTFGVRTPGTPGDPFGRDSPGSEYQKFGTPQVKINHIEEVLKGNSSTTPLEIDRPLISPVRHCSPKDGDYFSVPVNFDGQYEARGRSKFIMELPERPKRADRDQSCESSPSLIRIVPFEELMRRTAPSPTRNNSPLNRHSSRALNRPKQASMVYNEYGGLVDPNKPKQVTPSDLTVIDILRLIKKAYHHEFRDRMGEIILHEMDGSISLVVNDGGEQHHISSWQFQPPKRSISELLTPDPIIQGASRGSPRILELGCGSGAWCFHVKSEHPDWIVHGIDDTDHWLCVHKDIKLRDFLDTSDARKGVDDYFGGADSPSDLNPQFSVRNLNNLLIYDPPLQRGSYSLVRGRQVFEKIESYKCFLDGVRLLLHPGGVVEFLEVDPRPRTQFIGPMRQCAASQKTEAFTYWTDSIEDRLGDICESDLQDTVPGWTTRIEEVLNASLRPRDGVPAANLKTWLQASGFYDVKQAIFRLPIGGDTSAGKKLQDLLLYQFELEDSIPKLKSELPEVEIDDIKSGLYYLNFHIVTGRKPQEPRTGDLLPDGTRNEMTPSTYSAMAREKFNDGTAKSHIWERFDLPYDTPERSTLLEQGKNSRSG